ncbi:MAG: hypothetical protein HXS47_00140 [Theionarchaea archaeon]|nr:hypothetical protein [Theionarchaea archaeon]
MKQVTKIAISLVLLCVFSCSIVMIISESSKVTSWSREADSSETPEGSPWPLPPLESYEEAIALADAFLIETLGEEFFHERFTFVEIEEFSNANEQHPLLSIVWFVCYDYYSNGYTVRMKVAVEANQIPVDQPRVDVLFSNVICEPQEILITEEQAKVIAEENGLTPPFKVILECGSALIDKQHVDRIYWNIISQSHGKGEMIGIIIDAETGKVLDSWR